MGNRGLSLIEVFTAVALASLLGVSILVAVSQGNYIGIISKQRTFAYSLAREIAEEYSDWTTLDSLDGSMDGIVTNNTYTYNPSVPATYMLMAVSVNNVLYVPSLTIADGPGYPSSLKQVTINIWWNRGNFVLTTLKANY